MTGCDPSIEFLAADRPPPREGAVLRYRTFRREVTTARLLENVLRAYAFAVPHEDLRRDVRLAASELDAHLRELADGRVTPLNVLLREADEWTARQACSTSGRRG